MSYSTGDIVLCPSAYFDTPQQGEIVDIREDGMAYVHFRQQDRRLDTWARQSDLTFISSPANYSASVLPNKKKKRRSNVTATRETITENRLTTIRNLETIQMGRYFIDCWYYSPYPKQFCTTRHMYICDICLLYFSDVNEYKKHSHPMCERRPPGREIYRNGNLSLFEVRAIEQKLFCQCLSLLSKLFLDDVAIFYDVENFLFYILCECDEDGAHVVAFFSRESNWLDNNVLACILVLPPHQMKGYGRLMISCAYEMAKRMGIIGGPERPLSDMGKAAFHAYWRDTVYSIVYEYRQYIKDIDHIVTLTSIFKTDVINALKELKFLYKARNEWTNALDREAINEAFKVLGKPKPPKIPFDPKKMIWFRCFTFNQDNDDSGEEDKISDDDARINNPIDPDAL